MTAAEVEYLLEALGEIATEQPDEHPLYRVNRDQSRVYETGATLDMQTPMHKRTGQLKKANYVGIASETTNPTPVGPNQRYDLQTACSIRLEGMGRDGGEFGHIDPDGEDAVQFGPLFREVLAAIRTRMSYPDVGRPDVSYRDLTLTNVDNASANYADYFAATFDVQFRGYTDA